MAAEGEGRSAKLSHPHSTMPQSHLLRSSLQRRLLPLSLCFAADVDLKRASFEVTAEGVLKTRAFAIGKTGFRRTSDADLSTPASSSSPHLPTPLASSSAASASSQSSAASQSSSPSAAVARPHLDISDDTILEMGLLGRGAGGKVLKSLHKPSLTVVALKCIDVSDKNKRAQLLKELKELDTEYSAHIVAFYGAYYKDLTCTVQLGLEYMNRGSLQHIVHEFGALHELALTHVVKQSLLGLLHLHTHRKLHRDIKPGNILANHFGVAKLSDFGIIAELSNSMAKCGTFVGTTIYMSPERLTSEAYSYPADVWSLGMTIITMATGSFPLSTEDGYWGLVMHFNTQPSPNLPDSFSASFRDFVGHCLMKEPAKRWAVKELLEHPWILNGCEAEEALTYWPEGARMHQPDAELVRKQKEERLEKLRRWEEADEKKKTRAALKHKRKQSMAEGLSSPKEASSAAAAAEASEPTERHGGEEDEDSAKVRHRRKQAITRFHPVGLLHLQAEAHVQSNEKQAKSSATDLYGDGSDEEDDSASSHASPALKPQLNPLTSRSKRALAAAAPATTTAAQQSTASSTATAGRLRGLSAAKSTAESSSTLPTTQKDEKTEARLGSLARPTASGSPSRQPAAAAAPAPDFNLVSPTRAARQNVKFVNGQMMAVGLPSTTLSTGQALTKQQSAPAQLVSPGKGQSAAEGPAFSFPSISSSPASPELPATALSAAQASSFPILPAIAAQPPTSLSVSPPVVAALPLPSPSSPAGGAARPKSLAPLRVESSVTTRDRSASTGDSPSINGVDSISPLPVQSRGAPKLHRRYPSVPAASLVASPGSAGTSPVLAAAASPLSLSSYSSAGSTSSSDSQAIYPVPLSPLPPSADVQQRRGLRGRRPSMANADNSPAVPSSRSVMRLPSLPNTAAADGTDTDKDIAAAVQPLPVSGAAEGHSEKGLRNYRSSISAAFTTYDLPPVTPAHFRSTSSNNTPHSPLTPQPLSPRAARMLTIISTSEMDDLHTILRTLINLYKDREQKDSINSSQAVPSVNDIKSASTTATSERTGQRKNSLPAYPSRSQSISVASSDGLDSPPSESSPTSSDSGSGVGLSVGGVYGWSWLPDDRAVGEDLERIADQLGIRLSVVMHVFRKLLY